LTRRISRIYTNDVVRDACAPFVPPDAPSAVIPLGHELGYFRRPTPRAGLSSPVRVGYTTWKSTVGDRVVDQLAGDGRFEFRAIRELVGWGSLRELYHWCDVFLGCPNPEEGFYMPGLEAMEAGALVIVPDVAGNLAYCRFGLNCLEARHEDEDSYVAALEHLITLPIRELDAMRRAAGNDVHAFDLAHERSAFGTFLQDLDRRLSERADRMGPPQDRRRPYSDGAGSTGRWGLVSESGALRGPRPAEAGRQTG
jgi:hypothetical protein